MSYEITPAQVTYTCDRCGAKLEGKLAGHWTRIHRACLSHVAGEEECEGAILYFCSDCMNGINDAMSQPL